MHHYYLGKYLKLEVSNIYLSKVIAEKKPNSILFCMVIFNPQIHRFSYFILFTYLEAHKCFTIFLSNPDFLDVNFDFLKTRIFVGFLSHETLASEIKIL